MPSFDVVNKVDMQEIDNAVNMTKKVISTRYDFRKSQTEITLSKKEQSLHILTEDKMKLEAIQAELIGNLTKRDVDAKALDFQEVERAAGDMIKRDVKIKEGIDSDTAKKIVKLIKDEKLKVQAKIQDEQVRVSGKKIDDLQAVISLLKEQDLGVPLQYVNMKS